MIVSFLFGCEKEELNSNSKITAHFDVRFAALLEERGYVTNAREIRFSDVKNIKELDISGDKLTSISGIEYFESLTRLNCSENQLVSLDVSKNTALVYFDCSVNRIADLDISNNMALTHLNVSDNRFSILDISKNTALTYFNCAANQFTGIDVSDNRELTHLDCHYNQLLALDVTKNTVLISLNCSGNQLSSLNISDNRELKELSCLSNPGNGSKFIITVSFDRNNIPDGFTKAGWIYYRLIESESNPVVTSDFDSHFAYVLKSNGYIPDAEYILLSDVDKIEYLDISRSGELDRISGIQYFASLKEFHCQWNKIYAVDFSKNTALTILDCRGNRLSKLDFSPNAALTTLWCEGNELSSLNVSNNPALITLDCGENNLLTLDVSKNSALVNLSCNNNQLTSLDVSNNTALIRFNCSYNFLTSLDVSKNTVLKDLSHSYNLGDGARFVVTTAPAYSYFTTNGWNYDNHRITAYYRPLGYNDPVITKDFDPKFAAVLKEQRLIPDAKNILLSDVSTLESLNVSFSNLTSLSGIEHFTSLKDLLCSQNQLTSLDISKNIKLESLHCDKNQLVSLNVSNNVALMDLWCRDNQIKFLDVSNNINIKRLNCCNNRITALDISKNTALKGVWCSENPGNGVEFIVIALFDVKENQDDTSTDSWEYDDNIIKIVYRKVD